jgi:hypothetical protein
MTSHYDMVWFETNATEHERECSRMFGGDEKSSAEIPAPDPEQNSNSNFSWNSFHSRTFDLFANIPFVFSNIAKDEELIRYCFSFHFC